MPGSTGAAERGGRGLVVLLAEGPGFDCCYSVHLSEPQFPHLQSGATKGPVLQIVVRMKCDRQTTARTRQGRCPRPTFLPAWMVAGPACGRVPSAPRGTLPERCQRTPLPPQHRHCPRPWRGWLDRRAAGRGPPADAEGEGCFKKEPPASGRSLLARKTGTFSNISEPGGAGG